jgi:RHS repeat-associated protein
VGGRRLLPWSLGDARTLTRGRPRPCALVNPFRYAGREWDQDARLYYYRARYYDSRRTQLTRPNGVNTDYTYDNLSRLLSILHKLNGNAIDGATYTVDNVGNRSTKLNHLNGITDTYTYDAIYQLTQVDQNPGGTPTTTVAYAYDAVGNRLSDLTTANWTYNSSFHRKNVGAVSLAQISGYTVRRSSGFSELLQPRSSLFT